MLTNTDTVSPSKPMHNDYTSLSQLKFDASGSTTSASSSDIMNMETSFDDASPAMDIAERSDENEAVASPEPPREDRDSKGEESIEEMMGKVVVSSRRQRSPPGPRVGQASSLLSARTIPEPPEAQGNESYEEKSPLALAEYKRKVSFKDERAPKDSRNDATYNDGGDEEIDEGVDYSLTDKDLWGVQEGLDGSLTDKELWGVLGEDRDDGNVALNAPAADESSRSVVKKSLNFSYGDFNMSLEESGLDPTVMAALRRTQLQCDKSVQHGQKLQRARNRLRVIACFQHNVEKDAGSDSSGTESTASSLLTSMRRSAITHEDLDEFSDHMVNLELMTKRKDWCCSFRDLDPRFMILKFFNELSLEGVENFESKSDATLQGNTSVPKILRGFIRCGVFSVWRPTSNDAIRKMITGEGVGKGLDIKGKSAKCGAFSGFVPFLQIHANEHKKKVAPMRSNQRVRVFYPNQASRDEAAVVLTMLSQAMDSRAKSAEQVIRNKGLDNPKVCRRSVMIKNNKINFCSALKTTARCLMTDPSVYIIDDYASGQGVYGLDICEKVFWEGYVVANDITRTKGSRYDTGRPSMPEFQQMNVETLRNWSGKPNASSGNVFSDEGPDPRPVLWHGDCGRLGEEAPAEYNPMCPLGLLMAYEEKMKVIPVVSDFDCFLLGTRGVHYREPLGAQEIAMMSMCVDDIEGILDTPKEGNWTQRWLEVKKKHAMSKDESPTHVMPRFGYADPRSYKIMTGAVKRLESNGAVRHGPECFNYGFPQDLDEHYLVVSDTFDGVPWRYVNSEQLIDVLSEKIDQGFTFPLNPKWILCDSGWKKVYDKLVGSQKANVQDSMRIWYPDEIRARIDGISTKFPLGFVDPGTTDCIGDQSSGVQADLAELELRKYKIRMGAKEKIQLVQKHFVHHLYQSARAFEGLGELDDEDYNEAGSMQDGSQSGGNSTTSSTESTPGCLVSNIFLNHVDDLKDAARLTEDTDKEGPKAGHSSGKRRRKSWLRFSLNRGKGLDDQRREGSRRRKSKIVTRFTSIRDVVKRTMSGSDRRNTE